MSASTECHLSIFGDSASWPGVEYLFNRRLLTRHVSVYLRLSIELNVVRVWRHCLCVSIIALLVLPVQPCQTTHNDHAFAPLTHTYSCTHVLKINICMCRYKILTTEKTPWVATPCGCSGAAEPFCTTFQQKVAHCSSPDKGAGVSSSLHNTI